MDTDIKSKLRMHLSTPMDTECKVVYLLVQVRKLIEAEINRNEGWTAPPALWLHCNWALHVNLDHRGTTLPMLKRIDAYIQNNVAGHAVHDRFSFMDEEHLFRDLLHHHSLRRDLKDFLSHHHIPTDLCENDDAWRVFMRSYIGIVEDGSLSAKPQFLHAIKKVDFKRGPQDNEANLSITWVITLKDGRTIHAELQNYPNFESRGITVLPAVVNA